MAFLTFGVGYHNFHHRFQYDYLNGVKAWAFDPTKWATWCLSKVGLVSGLRCVTEHQILLAEMKEARKRVGRRLADIHELDTSVCGEALQAILALEERFALAYHVLGEAIDRKSDFNLHGVFFSYPFLASIIPN